MAYPLQIEPLELWHLDELAAVLLHPEVYEHIGGADGDARACFGCMMSSVVSPVLGSSGQPLPLAISAHNGCYSAAATRRLSLPTVRCTAGSRATSSSVAAVQPNPSLKPTRYGNQRLVRPGLNGMLTAEAKHRPPPRAA